MKPEIKPIPFSKVFCKTTGQDVDLIFGHLKGSTKNHLNECSGIEKCTLGINNCPHKNTIPTNISLDDGTSFFELG